MEALKLQTWATAEAIRPIKEAPLLPLSLHSVLIYGVEAIACELCVLDSSTCSRFPTSVSVQGADEESGSWEEQLVKLGKAAELLAIIDCINEVAAAISAASARMSNRVETTPRLAQWRIDSLSPFSYRKSDPFKIGLWNWYLAVEKNKQFFVKLYPEGSSLTREKPPIASLTIKIVSLSAPNLNTLIHPGISDKLLKSSDDCVWAIDTLFTGRFIIDVEFLDLKIIPPSGGEPASIWTSYQVAKHAEAVALNSLGRMLTDGVHTDITINVADSSIGAHRAILAARSPVFCSMFYHNLREKELSTINISDMSFDSCRAFLNYIYGNFQSEEFMIHRIALLQAADKYDISDLKEACHESLVEDIDTSNVLERLQVAHLHQLSELKSSCIQYLVNFRKIYEILRDFNDFMQSADRELIAELFEEVLAAWKGL